MNEHSRSSYTKKRICRFLKQGLYKRDAAVMGGIDESTFYRWLKEDASFASRVELNILRYKQSLVEIINEGMIKKPEIAFKMLQLRWPEDYVSPPSQLELDQQESRKSMREIADTLQKIIQEGSEVEAEPIHNSPTT